MTAVKTEIGANEAAHDAPFTPTSSVPKSTVQEAIDYVAAQISANTGAWGAITGTLSNQTDLQAALDAKQPLDADLTSWAGVSRASGFDTFAATPSSANLAAAVSDETGTGALVFANSPTLVTPALGTPSALVLTNATGLPTAGLLDDAVTNAKLANMATATIKGRTTAGTGDPEDLTAAQTRGVLSLPTSTVAGRMARYTGTAGEQGQTSSLSEDGSGVVTLSLNSATPPTPVTGTVFHIAGADSAASRFLFDAFAINGTVTFRRSNGTAASPSALLSDNVIGSLVGFGYGATGYSAGARAGFAINASQNWTDAAQGTYLTLLTTANGSTSITERIRITDAGLTGFLTSTPTEAVDVNSDAIRIRTSQTPASASATGDAGMICWDSNYIYVCVATNTWKRVAIATW